MNPSDQEFEDRPSRRALIVRSTLAWVCWGIMFWLMHEEAPFEFFVALFVISFVLIAWDFQFYLSESKRKIRYPNGSPDADVEALRTGSIDISEYRQRKERQATNEKQA